MTGWPSRLHKRQSRVAQQNGLLGHERLAQIWSVAGAHQLLGVLPVWYVVGIKTAATARRLISHSRCETLSRKRVPAILIDVIFARARHQYYQTIKWLTWPLAYRHGTRSSATLGARLVPGVSRGDQRFAVSITSISA